MPQYLPMSAKDYYDPVPGWQFGLGVAENIERARANRAREIQARIDAENHAKQVAAQQEAMAQQRAILNEERLGRIQREQAEAALPGVWSGIANQAVPGEPLPATAPGDYVLRPEFRGRLTRGLTPETYVEAAAQTGAPVPPSAAIFGRLGRQGAAGEVGDPSSFVINTDPQGNPLPTPVQVMRQPGYAPKIVQPAKAPYSDRTGFGISKREYDMLKAKPDADPAALENAGEYFQAQARKNGQDVIFNEDGTYKIVEGIDPSTRKSLSGAIQASLNATDLVSSIIPKVDNVFGPGKAARAIGQKVGGAHVGLGLTPEQVDMQVQLKALSTEILRGALMSEKGATSNSDRQIAMELAGDDFIKQSPEQVKARLAALERRFEQTRLRNLKAMNIAPVRQMREGAGAESTAVKTLDAATAAEFLRQSGGDKAKARQMAKEAGYTF